SLEIRDLSAAKIDSIFKMIQAAAKEIAAKNSTPISFAPIDVTAIPAPTDLRVRKIIAEAAKELGLSYKFMPSGAGHDAQEVAHIAPVGMIFVPSKGGVSHSPKEFTSAEDMANGANVLLQAVLKIDKGKL
ncbi:MAG: M20/M25/M40 family metallo-hydrolase, partial [bacterium]